MVERSLTPSKQSVSLKIPIKMVRKNVKVILLTDEEKEKLNLKPIQEKSNVGKFAKFKGMFTYEEGQEMRKQIAIMRNEWERNI